MEELIDIYRADRTFLGRTIPREGAHLLPGEYMLYVLALIQDAQGRYVITQRSHDKHWAPGCWEIPGGGVLAGETTQQAVVREVHEEVGLNVAACPLEVVYSYTNEDSARGDNYIVDIFRFRIDVDESHIVLQESEAIDCRFATWEDICSLAERGEFLHFERLQAAREKLAC